MRPRGEVRAALSEAAQALRAECGAASWRDMAERAGVGYQAARQTVENMARAGELVPVGFEKRAHSRRWVALYEPGAALMIAPPARRGDEAEAICARMARSCAHG